MSVESAKFNASPSARFGNFSQRYGVRRIFLITVVTGRGEFLRFTGEPVAAEKSARARVSPPNKSGG